MTMISVISSVLLLGNIEFEDSGDDNKECRLMEESSNILSKIARNLKIEDSDLRKALLTKKLANMNIVKILNKTGCESNRDGFAKNLY
jgi:myosin heavy subunit